MHKTLPIVLKVGPSSLIVVWFLMAAATPLRAQTNPALPFGLQPTVEADLISTALPASAPSTPLNSRSAETAAKASGPYTPLALPCSINVACSEGSGHSDAIKATVKILRGGEACSGVLLNNTAQDGTPYILTARHCGNPSVGETVNWTFQFHYKSSTCADPANTPVAYSLTGATVVATQGGIADFALLELSQPIPEEYDVVFAGWSRKDSPASSSVVIGHPSKDIMKITLEDDPLVDAVDSWVATFDHGTIESGSSGAPLFKGNAQVIGHVRSAVSIDYNACSGPEGDDNAATILFPKFGYIWNQGGLAAFLDPEGTNQMSLSAVDGETVLPVELTSFDAQIDGPDVLLRWETASETNNAGFEIQSKSGEPDLENGEWEGLDFVEGYGTTLETKTYQYRVEDLDPGRYTFRLKQIDYDGTFEYHPEVEVLIEVPAGYYLSAAYPNPFNPQAQFRLSVARRQQVLVEVYNALGQRVAHLFEGTLEADVARAFTIDGSDLQSGLYLYRVVGETFSESRSVLLVK